MPKPGTMSFIPDDDGTVTIEMTDDDGHTFTHTINTTEEPKLCDAIGTLAITVALAIARREMGSPRDN